MASTAISWYQRLQIVLLGYERIRLRQLKKAPDGPIKDYLSMPFPSPKTAIKDVPLVALDFETTGLNPESDQLLSAGLVEFSGHQIPLSSSYHQIVKTQGELNRESVVIHQITDQVKEQGVELETVVETLLKRLTGKVMLAHFARIEVTFLQNACFALYGMRPVLPVVDTLFVAKRRFDRSDTPYDPNNLRLSNLRERFKLPGHFAHNALNDAIATAELLIALQFSEKDGENQPLSQYLL